jgi:hypothetical protein
MSVKATGTLATLAVTWALNGPSAVLDPTDNVPVTVKGVTAPVVVVPHAFAAVSVTLFAPSLSAGPPLATSGASPTVPVKPFAPQTLTVTVVVPAEMLPTLLLGVM